MNKTAILLIFSIFFASCGNNNSSHESESKSEYIKLQGTALGTFFTITYLHPTEKDFSTELDSLFKAFNASLSTYDSTSIISKVNRNEDVELDNFFVTCFKKAHEVYLKTDGNFDITIAPIVNMYGFGFTEKQEIEQERIDSLLEFVGMDKIKIEGKRIVKEKESVMLDGNAIAKGYCVDIVADYLHKNKCDNYMVEIGGEVVTKGKNPKQTNWRIGIDKPIENKGIEDRQLQEIIDISGWALATSGNYRKFYEENGVKYSHSISPKTGKPVRKKLLSATVIAKDCMTADAYATACMVLGLEKAEQLIKSLPETEAYFISSGTDGNYKITMTEGMKKFIAD